MNNHAMIKAFVCLVAAFVLLAMIGTFSPNPFVAFLLGLLVGYVMMTFFLFWSDLV